MERNYTKGQLFWTAFFAAVIVASTFLLFSYTSFRKGNHEQDELYRKIITQKYSVYSFPVPDSVDFCGERVPLERDDCFERLDRELLVNTYFHSNTFLCLKRSARWYGIISQILAEEGIPDDFKYLCTIESSLANAVSPSGAAGFWQFLPETAKTYGLEVNDFVDERYDTEKATRAACAFLKEARAQFGSWAMAAASYNMGRNGLAKACSNQQESEYWYLSLNEETSRYLFRILAVKEIFQHPESYGYVMRQEDVYAPWQYSVYETSEPIANLADFAKQKQCKYRDLKYLNPWLRANELPNKTGKTYKIKLLKSE